MTSERLVKTVCLLGAVLVLCAGCGRKLPPLPPGLPDPVRIASAKFIGDEVVVEAECNVAGGNVLLLGKPKGICPSCTDDLVQKDEKPAEEAAVIRMTDPRPDEPYMVYRLAFRKGSLFWMTDAKVVRK
ncbi:MAG TPA: hypothetical protein PLE36_06475 [Deltaproteobacteria bacterium]|nr:hypothetical protein [Deltaproteobacteria bacterium]HOD69661.1 hypothetical protein [Deltaproteobacteria bacterium]HOE72765.1 hypothetical protein [Deltaproteobacteria bacterium]HON61296.1 hypothetical protein [Deltaproteobacteria bacterium]HPA84993.1 hypothetical protein [Deltaproteobacteria bacterium]